MSERGKILVASDQGNYLLRFVGDVRVTLCVAIDDFLAQMFGDPLFSSVVVNLDEASGLDSTSLGLLVKLAKESLKRTRQSPYLCCSNADMRRTLESVGIEDLFEQTHLSEDASSTSSGSPAKRAPLKGRSLEGDEDSVETHEGELCQTAVSEQATRQRVVEAHRLLMSLNPKNAAAFKDLVASLEALDQGAPRAWPV